MTIQELFGPQTIFMSGVLQIDVSDLAIAHGYNGNIELATPGQLFSLIVRQAQIATESKTADPTCGVTISRSFDSIVDRGGVSHIGYGYTCTLYTANTAATLDPDSVI